jgi:hypothetical protein
MRLAAVVGAVVGAAALLGGGPEGTGTAADAVPSAPRQIVAVTNRGTVVVLWSRDGRVLRTLARGADQGTTVAVTPDARRVFFDRLTDNARACFGREIVSVPVKGGKPTLVASASSNAAVSPDGTKLAFVKYQGASDCKAPPRSLVVTSLAEPRHGVIGWTVPDQQVPMNPSWARDSRHLAFSLIDSGGASVRVLDTGAPHVPEVLGTAPKFPQSPKFAWYGYFGRLDAFLGDVVMILGARPTAERQYGACVVDDCAASRGLAFLLNSAIAQVPPLLN